APRMSLPSRLLQRRGRPATGRTGQTLPHRNSRLGSEGTSLGGVLLSANHLRDSSSRKMVTSAQQSSAIAGVLERRSCTRLLSHRPLSLTYHVSRTHSADELS